MCGCCVGVHNKHHARCVVGQALVMSGCTGIFRCACCGDVHNNHHTRCVVVLALL